MSGAVMEQRHAAVNQTRAAAAPAKRPFLIHT